MTGRTLSVATGSEAVPVAGSNERSVAFWLVLLPFAAAYIAVPSREMPRPLFACMPRSATSTVEPFESAALMSIATTLPALFVA